MIHNLIEYKRELNKAFDSIKYDSYLSLIEKLNYAYNNEKQVFVCGNGGSAAIAEHFTCDHLKGIRENDKQWSLRPRVTSLSSNFSLISAIANDLSYEKIFAYQLASLGKIGDLLICISSSGNSPNIIEALKQASNMGIVSFSIVGFDGGDAAEWSSDFIHINSHNYGIVEDVSQSIMHCAAQSFYR